MYGNNAQKEALCDVTNGTEISASLVTGASNRYWLRPLALP